MLIEDAQGAAGQRLLRGGAESTQPGDTEGIDSLLQQRGRLGSPRARRRQITAAQLGRGQGRSAGQPG